MFNEIQVPQTVESDSIISPSNGGLTTSIVDGVISAKRVDVKRDIAVVMANIRASASAMGEKYYYHWETKNRDGSRGKVEGGTIKLAMDIARLHGNCQVDCRVQDAGTHLEFHARFVDIESGFSLTRPFRQRKDQNTGMKDKARAEDIVLQIGASKAIRNVILNSLPTLAEYAVQEAKKGLLARVSRNPDGARTAILEIMQEIGLPLVRVEKIIGRININWTNQDLVKLYVQVESIKENHATIDDIFPDNTEQKIESKGTEALKENMKKESKPKPEKKVEPQEELKQECHEIDDIIINFPDGNNFAFPQEIDIVALMTEIQNMFPGDEPKFIKENKDAWNHVIKFMRSDNKEAAAKQIEGLVKKYL